MSLLKIGEAGTVQFPMVDHAVEIGWMPVTPQDALYMLRASVPQKIIGDLLGHRSSEATIPYLKLATEDLRAIALDVPGSEVLA